MNFDRKERDTTLITLSIAKGSNPNAVMQQLMREASTAMNIKDSDTRKKVLKALGKAKREVSEHKVENGYCLFAAYDDS
jgi:peptide subunit release factor 1 (eRF1)